MTRVIVVGIIGTLLTGTGMALYERDALRPVLEAITIVATPIVLGAWIHPVVGITAALVILEGLYEANQADLLEERKRQLRTLWYRFCADARRGRQAIQQRLQTWLAARCKRPGEGEEDSV